MQALGLCFLVSVAALGVTLGMTAKFDLSLWELILPLATSLAGMYAGQALRDRISPASFRRYFFGSLVRLGGYLAIHAA